MIPNDERDLRGKNVVVLVFAMDGCSHCEEYVPRFLEKAGDYLRAGMPIFVYDLASEDASIVKIAEQYKIDSAPTTLVLLRGNGWFKMSGSKPDEAIDWALGKAYQAHQAPR